MEKNEKKNNAAADDDKKVVNIQRPTSLHLVNRIKKKKKFKSFLTYNYYYI